MATSSQEDDIQDGSTGVLVHSEAPNYTCLTSVKVKQMIYIAVLCNPKITAEPLYN